MPHDSRAPLPVAPAIPPRPRRGILVIVRSPRRAALLAGMAVIGLLSSLPSLPQGAFADEADRGSVRAEAVTTSPRSIPPVVRDGFAVSTFSVVQWPVPVLTPISSGFGFRDCDGCSTDHTGTDFNPGSGFPVQSIAAGIVTEAGWESSGYGNRVVVRHMIDGQTVSSLYAHLQDGSIGVGVGDTIAPGQQLGLVGSTGESTGAHLHFSVITDGVMLDPYPWLVAHVNS